MPFITQGKTNFKNILIVVILATVVAGLSWWGLTHVFFEPWNMEELIKRRQEQTVSLKTDKTEYKQGETVKITIQNNLNQSVWYWDNRGRIIPLVGIQVFENGEWENVEGKDACACKTNCITYAANWTELKSKETLTDSWETKEDCLGKAAKKGKYRVWFSYDLDFTGQNNPDKFLKVYSNEFEIKEKEVTGQCSPIDFSGYELAKDIKSNPFEFQVDLNNDQKEELVRVYREADAEGNRRQPIIVKIFSGNRDCLKEELSYKAIGENEVYVAEVMLNFWGDGRNVVMVEGVSTGYGSGSTQQLHFFTWQDGKYLVVEGPEYEWWQGAASGYMFYGEEAKGTKIILAKSKPVFTEEGSVLPYYQFEIYDWNGNQYIKTEGGITKNTYSWQWWEEDSESFIKRIIQAEPEVLEPVK